jgi:SPP1 gp7 family putative phage head morphogenesis protein
VPTEYERRRQRIADARPWKIDRTGAPSPRGYIQLVNRTIRQWRRQVYAALGLNRASDAEDPKPKTPAERAAESLREQEQARDHARRLQLLRLVPPSPTEVEAVGKPAARVAMRTARRSVQAAGVPLAEVALRLGVEVPLVLGVDIAATLGEQTALTAWSRAGTDLIRSVGQDLVAGLDAEIADAARRGVLARDLRSLVDDRLGVGARHAQFIARDQIAKLNGKITEATHKAAGITAYKWRASRDQRTRDDHRALDGTIQQWDAPPVVDQRTGRTGHPGDDFQCFLADSPVSGVFVAGVRGHYEGPAVHLETAGGRRLSVTANHPVLTPRGFVAAGDLCVGDHVVCDTADVDRPESVDPHDRPALAAEVFRLLAVVGRVDRVAVRAEDFHGDGAGHQGDVDIVRAGRALLNDMDPMSLQGGGDLRLPRANTGNARLIRPGDLSLGRIGLGDSTAGPPSGGALPFGGPVDLLEALPLQTLRFRPAANGATGQPDDPGDLGALEPGSLGDFEHGSARVVSVQHLSDLVVGDGGRLPRGADLVLAAAGEDRGVQGLSVHPEALGRAGDRLAGRVTLEQVVKVNVNPSFSGHVYSLQTTTGLVVSDGVITSNCRCVAIPVVGDVERAAPSEREPPPVVDVPVRRPPPRKRQPAPAATVAPPPAPGLEHLSAREQSLLSDLSIQTQRDPTSYLKAFGAKKPAEQAALLAPLLEQGLVEQTEAGLRVTERYRDLSASRPLTEAQLQALLGL